MSAKVLHFIGIDGKNYIEVYRDFNSRKLSFPGYEHDFTETMPMSGTSRDIYKQA
jgi:hypothetical protein